VPGIFGVGGNGFPDDSHTGIVPLTGFIAVLLTRSHLLLVLN